MLHAYVSFKAKHIKDAITWAICAAPRTRSRGTSFSSLEGVSISLYLNSPLRKVKAQERILPEPTLNQQCKSSERFSDDR